ncbi:hypothetical protein [Mycobacteroides abscessus]|uniref:hypothetical protein n=1 Tax=Mycobacteroides abscessus TaxID=36809 RepID=UPI0012FFDB95
MSVTLMGFDGAPPHSVIVWSLNGQECSKTVCYSLEDEQAAVSRFNTAGDFYNHYDRATVIRSDDSLIEIRPTHIEEGHGFASGWC